MTPCPCERIDGLDETDGSYRQEVLHIIICILILLGHMRHQTHIPLDECGSRLLIPFLVSFQTLSFLSRS